MKVEYRRTSTGRIIRRNMPETPAEVITVREAEANGARLARHSSADNERQRNSNQGDNDVP